MTSAEIQGYLLSSRAISRGISLLRHCEPFDFAQGEAIPPYIVIPDLIRDPGPSHVILNSLCPFVAFSEEGFQDLSTFLLYNQRVDLKDIYSIRQYLKRYLVFAIIALFSLLLLTAKNANIFLSFVIASLLLIPVALFKPALAMPFLKNTSRKVIVPTLAGIFIGSTILSPQVNQSMVGSSQITASPTATATPTMTPSPTVTPTIVPTAKPTNKPIPTFIPTAIPLPTAVYVPPTNPPVQQPVYQAPAVQDTSGGFVCDCGKVCAAMSSCAEAQFQLNNCGCSKRDGDHDGIACDNMCQ